MSRFSVDQLSTLGRAEEVQIAPSREDGTSATPTPIWIVHVGGRLIIRSYRGARGHWYQTLRSSGRAHLSTAGFEGEVIALALALTTDERVAVDEAYREKYGRYGQALVGQMTSEESAATTLALLPA